MSLDQLSEEAGDRVFAKISGEISQVDLPVLIGVVDFRR